MNKFEKMSSNQNGYHLNHGQLLLTFKWICLKTSTSNVGKTGNFQVNQQNETNNQNLKPKAYIFCNITALLQCLLHVHDSIVLLYKHT